MLTLEKLSKMISIGLLIWIIISITLIISFDLYRYIFLFIFTMLIFTSGLTIVNMMKKYYK